jgi:serine O-acetyltransferase
MDNNIFQKNVALLSRYTEQEEAMEPANDSPLPSVEALHEIVQLVKMIVFPGFFDKRNTNSMVRSYHIGVNMERLAQLLHQQLRRALLFNTGEADQQESQDEAADQQAEKVTMMFIDRLPELKRLLFTDVEAIYNDDPAAKTYGEVVFSYPVIQAMLHYRVAHELYAMGIPVIPRIITEEAHANTGIDIHPGARIGEYFSIDHGTGVVIGETCIIGNHVTLYQGVTLGAKNFKLEGGCRTGEVNHDVPRHPIIEDNVTIYSNSTLLGRITIGHDTVVGGNIWLTHSVPPHSKILQSKALDVSFTGGLGI